MSEKNALNKGPGEKCVEENRRHSADVQLGTVTLNIITVEKLASYFLITGEALDKVRTALDDTDAKRLAQAADFLDMAQRYYDDASFFRTKSDFVNAFAALNYAHGWLDAGARIRLFRVNDSRLFTVDGAPSSHIHRE